MRSSRPFLLIFAAGGLLLGQTAGKQAPADSSSTAERALKLAEDGHCQEALPLFNRIVPRLTDKQLLHRAAMGQARCAMARDDTQTAVSALMLLKRDFPDDPEVLYICVHYFSELAARTSQELAAKAPTSSQARRLEAEAFESHGKFDEAAGMYRGILRDNPNEPGIHYRLGEVLLAKAGNSGPTDEARAEFQKELEIDPRNAGAEFTLGELDRHAGRLDDAIRHFTRASQIDPSFAEAYLGLGISLASSNRFADAIKPLETYVKMEPGDPTGHYQLAMAYGRTGNREGAMREAAAQKEAAARQHPGGQGR